MKLQTLYRLPNLCYVAALCALPWIASALLPPALDPSAPDARHEGEEAAQLAPAIDVDPDASANR